MSDNNVFARLRARRLSDDRPRGAWKYYIIISLFSCLVVVPYIYLFSKAFTDIGGKFTLGNWTFLTETTVLKNGDKISPALPGMLYSFLFGACMATLVVIMTVPAAYAMSRTEFPGRKLLARLLIILDAFPGVALLIPYIFLLTFLKMTNKLSGVMLLCVGTYLPGAVWLMKGFFDNINWDMEWASIVDGASRFKTFFRIIVPAAKPGIAVILVNSFLSGWGQYMLISLFIYGKTTTMSSIIGKMFDYDDMKYTVSLGVMAAASLAYIIPVIIVFMISQKTLLEVRQGGSKQ